MSMKTDNIIGMESIGVPDVGNSTILLQIPYDQAKCTIVPFQNGEGSILYSVLLYDEITEPRCYMSLFRVCSKATEKDVIRVAIDTIGGSVSTAIAIKTALESTKAKVIYVALGDVMSAGTLLFDGTGECEICKYAHFMYHMSSGGMMGNTMAIIENSQQTLSYILDYLNEALENNCITKEEYDLIVNKRQDVYITGKEMAERLKKDIYKR